MRVIKNSNSQKKISFKELFKKIFSFKLAIRQIIILLFLSSVIQLALPFLTKSIVDIGIENRDVPFITIILIAQTVLFLGSISMEFVRNWLVLHIGLRINIDLSTLFTQSLINKELQYFEDKQEGDFLQRLIDNNRIENFLTNTTLSVLVSTINLLLFGVVLFIFNTEIFLTFLITTFLAIFWISFFLKKRKNLDSERFEASAKSRTELLEIINGVEDIRLNNIKDQRLARWVHVQKKLLKIRMKMLELGQFQKGGAVSIHQSKNIIITFLSAYAVINGEMTLGEMLAVQFIVGQLNSPVRDIVNFIQNFQDTDLSLNRLSDVIGMSSDSKNTTINATKVNSKLVDDIKISNFSYRKNGEDILTKIDINIPYGSKVGIVGESGSGKTSLLRCILGLIEESQPFVSYGNSKINEISQPTFFSNFSVILHDGHIFSDSIIYNITLTNRKDDIDIELLNKVLSLSLLESFVSQLPNKLYTRIGKGGKTISRGQKQRIFIARALYKKSNYLILDEFTNYLDNLSKEKIIENIYREYQNKTIISVSHKISDLMHSDVILFMKNGTITEEGNHENLLKRQGDYMKLFELENEKK